jgi:PAB1-binding protein PBP1
MIEHKQVMSEAAQLVTTHGVKVKGNKKYTMVKDRIELFRKHYGLDIGIDTTLLHHDDKTVIVQAKIIDANNKVIGSGLAEEQRDSSHITKTSAVEVAESSALGRALANIGVAGTEYASADEMISAIQAQEKIKEKSPVEEIKEHFPDAKEVTKEDTVPRDHHPLDDFQPEYNWPAWDDIQRNTIVKCSQKAEVKRYLDQKRDELKKYETAQPDKYAKLKDFINKKYKECER